MAYIFDPAKGETPETVAQKRKLADAFAARIFGRTPQNVGEGLSAIGQAWIAKSMQDEATDAQKAGLSAGNDAFSKISGMISGQPMGGNLPVASAAPSEPQIVPADQFNSIDAMADLKPETAAMLPRAQGAISNIESGGRYDIKGPITASGDRALGKYQVMGANVAPWTKEIMGKAMTPQEFIANPDAQDAVFNGKFGQYAEKYGAPGASKAWFAGEGGMKNPNAKDQLGTTVSAYADSFTGGMGDEGALPPGARPTQAQATQATKGPSTEQLIQAASNPWLNEGQRAVVNTMLKQRMEQEQKASDPLHQLQIKKAEADLQYGKNPESVREYQFAKDNDGFKGSFQDWIASKRGGAGEYGLTPVMGTGPDGKPALIQLGKNGKPIMTPLPDGFSIAREPIKVDGPTGTTILDPQTRQIVSFIPKDVRGGKREEEIGKGEGEAAVSLDSIKSKMPGLEKVVGELDKLSPDATYTLAGQGLNWLGRQAGMEPRDAAVARSNYISMVDNQVLPLLRDTFGAAFTVKEGESLRNTLGDPDKTPKEKQVVLKSFIEQKRRDVEALERRVGRQAPVGGAPVAPQGKTSSGVQWSVE